MFDAFGPGEIGNVDQTVDSLFDFHKRAEVGHVAYAALDYGADAVAVRNGGPGVGLELFQAQRDAPLLGMYVEHHGFDLVSRADHFRGMFHAPRPGHFGNVDQTLDAWL